jgi:hypothetical protein
MEDSEHRIPLDKPWPKAPTNTATTVLNGIGNGMMIGTLPFVALELYSHLKGKKIPQSSYKNTAIALVTGCTLGAVYGLYEAHENKKYEQAMNDEIRALRGELAEQKNATTRWEEKHAARTQHVTHADHEHLR